MVQKIGYQNVFNYFGLFPFCIGIKLFFFLCNFLCLQWFIQWDEMNDMPYMWHVVLVHDQNQNSKAPCFFFFG